MEVNLKSFVNSYLQTAAWVTVDSDECNEFTKDAKIIAENDCKAFIEAVKKEFGDELATELLSVNGTDVENRSAHDFFLTRNRHGAGYWDNPENYQNEDYANRLTKIAESMGSADVFHVRGKKSKLTF